MSLKEAILEQVEKLPEDKQREVLDFSIFLAQKYKAPSEARSLRGIFQGLAHVTEEDLAENRRELNERLRLGS